MSWRRLPTWFPNLRLRMLPLTKEQQQQVIDTGWLREVAFRAEPRVNKMEIKAFFESVHNMEVERVHTINYQGKRKRQIDEKGRPHYYRLSDWKKAYVVFKPPPEVQHKYDEQQRAEQQKLQEKEMDRQRLLQEREQQRREQQRRLEQHRLWLEQRRQQQQLQSPGSSAVAAVAAAATKPS
eukprot:GHRR01002501.1.p1 GENE.GHRR01002501.1~~GHRR01002501.1.p1  ORF type:complete len:181 (+),score=73.91 GHRR01002501.1:175-717(+)